MSRIGVLVSAGALVLAVWAALLLSRTTGAANGAPGAAAVPAFGAVPGFLSEAAYLPDDSLLGFVEIAAGPFLMGSHPERDPAAFDIERWSAGSPRGEVDLPTFYTARYEVTVAQYAAFVRATGHPLPETATLAAPPDHPVAFVAWPDALAYAAWLDGELRRDAVAPGPLRVLLDLGWRVTLPTEAQWEKAARGTDGRIFPWGDEPSRNRANYEAGVTTPVGTFGCPECPYEVYDMAGNVWEWTRSPYQPYPYDEADDRTGLDEDALWVMRGGSYADPPRFLRAANRGGADPGARRPFLGFRVVLVP